MTEGEITALMRGIAPVVKQYVAKELAPLRERLKELETEKSAQRNVTVAELLRRAGNECR